MAAEAHAPLLTPRSTSGLFSQHRQTLHFGEGRSRIRLQVNP